jgi:hypothetical protein
MDQVSIKYNNIFQPSKIYPNLDFWFENKPIWQPWPAGQPDWSTFRILGDLGTILKVTEVHDPNFRTTFFHGNSCVLILTKNRLGYIWATFFKKTHLVTLKPRYSEISPCYNKVCHSQKTVSWTNLLKSPRQFLKPLIWHKSVYV